MENSGYIDAESQSVAQGGSFKEIINRHIERILILGSTDFEGGYFNSSYSNNGTEMQTWIPDTLIQYCNSVLTLSDCIHAHFMMDEKTKNIDENTLKNYRIDLRETEEEAKKQGFEVLPQKNVREIKAKHHRRLFRALCDFLKSKNYLELRGYTDE